MVLYYTLVGEHRTSEKNLFLTTDKFFQEVIHPHHSTSPATDFALKLIVFLLAKVLLWVFQTFN